jgi:hypothetical protein
MSLLVNAPVIASIDLWSAYDDQIALSTSAEDILLTSIFIAGLPLGAKIVRAVMMFKYRTIENTSGGGNNISGGQNIQAQKAVDGSWVTGISLNGNECFVPATTRETGDVMMGMDDISGQVPENGAEMSFQWTQGQAADDELYFNDVQIGLRIWFII